jgi:tetratricopeptide (TPR) repeat protein
MQAKRAGGDVARLRHQVLVHAGHVQVLRADYAQAQQSFTRALREAESQRLGGRAVARALNGLGMVAKYTGQFTEAERLYHRALRELSTEAATGPLVATVFHNLGGLEHARRHLAPAERWARRGLALRSRREGAVITAKDVAALAAIVQARGRHAEAAALYRRALSTLRQRLGPGHFEVVFNLSQLAALEHARGRFLESRRLYRRSLPQLRRILGRDHPMVAGVVANFAKLLNTR